MKLTKKLFAVLFLFTVMATVFAFTPADDKKVVMIISIEVKNAVEWKKNFDNGAPVREKSGITVLSVCNSAENPNQVVIVEEAPTTEAANNFINVLKGKKDSGELLQLDAKVYSKMD